MVIFHSYASLPEGNLLIPTVNFKKGSKMDLKKGNWTHLSWNMDLHIFSL